MMVEKGKVQLPLRSSSSSSSYGERQGACGGCALGALILSAGDEREREGNSERGRECGRSPCRFLAEGEGKEND